jgi:hypothetical protein
MESIDDLRDQELSGESAPVRDPGLDRHEWETAWEGLQEQLHEAPAEALPELGGLVEEMLLTRGYAVDDPVADDGIEPDVLVAYRSARETTLLVERGEDVDPYDLGEAIHAYREIYEQLIDRPDN